MRRLMIVAGAAAFLAGCGDGADPVKNEPEAASSLKPGQYEAQWKVASLRSVDKTTPATNLKQDATGTTTACVTSQIDPALFAEDGDSCTMADPYVRNGRM